MQKLQNDFCLAIVGHTKVGKSSVVNALGGKKARDEGAAATGVVETTHEVKEYPCKLDGVRLFDVSGSGTMAHPEENYFM